MAKIFTDASTTLAEANLNKLLAGDGTVGSHSAGHACWGIRIRYVGAPTSAWEAVADYGAENQIANVVLTWHATHLDVGLGSVTNGFNASTYPVVVVSPFAAPDTRYIVTASATAYNNIQVNFWDMAGTAITTEAAHLDFNMILFGEL